MTRLLFSSIKSAPPVTVEYNLHPEKQSRHNPFIYKWKLKSGQDMQISQAIPVDALCYRYL